MLGFTGHHVVAADVDPDWLMAAFVGRELVLPLEPGFLVALGDQIGGQPHAQDNLLVAIGTGRCDAVPIDPALLDHPRVARALRYRDDVRVRAQDGAVLTVGRGLVGRYEVSVEVPTVARGRGLARRLVAGAPELVPAGVPLWAQVHPANVASIRTFLAAGYRPVGAEVLFTRSPGSERRLPE